MVENIRDVHVHFWESGSWQPYDKSTIYVDELNELFDELALRGRCVFPNPNVGDEHPKMNDYIAPCVQKHPNRLMGFSRTYPRREKDAIEKLMRNEEEIQPNRT